VPAKYRTEDVQTDVEVAEALWDSVEGDIPIGEDPHVEETLWKADPGYAGSADMIADPADAPAFVMDLKTSSSLQRSHELQIAAYAYAARERGVADVQRAAIVKLNYREPTAGVKWLDTDRLASLYDQFCELVDGFHAQQRLG
jgi:CRISPR/Cas system-associated exonuclease Cas4 (RecB family)